MRAILLIPLVYLAAVMETSLVDRMRIGNITPDLLALVAVIWLLTSTGSRAFLVAGAVMMVGDLISPGRVGIGMAWMLLVGYGLNRLRLRIALNHLVLQVPAVFVSVTAWAAGVGVSERLLGDASLPMAEVVARAFGVGFYTAGVALPVLMIVGWACESPPKQG